MNQIIWLASYPRSGNTLFRSLWHNLLDLPTFSVYEEGRRKEIPIPIGYMGIHPTLYDGPALTKTHWGPSWQTEPAYATDYPIILIIRDGRDVAISYYHYLTDIANLQEDPVELKKKVAKGSVPFGRWSTWMRSWLVTAPRSPAIVFTFNELIQLPPKEVIERTINALNGALEGARVKDKLPKEATFDHLHKHDPEFFRKGTNRQWIEDPEFIEMFMDHQKEGMDIWNKVKGVPPEARGLLLRG